jgi:hypothetical protein
MDKQAVRKARSGAVSLKIHVEEGDKFHRVLSRDSGLFFVTRKKPLHLGNRASIFLMALAIHS